MKLSKLLEFFQDDTHMFSATRLVFIAWNLAAIVIVFYSLFVLKTKPTLDASIVGILATVMSGKVVQSFAENKTTETPPTT